LIGSIRQIINEQNNFKGLIDQSLVDYYYSLIPKYYNARKPGHDAHITIIRQFELVAFAPYDIKYDEPIFFYSGQIDLIGKHFVVYCNSRFICQFRQSMGLPSYRHGFTNFHFTIGFL